MKKTTKPLFNILFWISLFFLWSFLIYVYPSCTEHQPIVFKGSDVLFSIGDEIPDMALSCPICMSDLPHTFDLAFYFNYRTGKKDTKPVESWRDYIPQELKPLQYYDTLVGNGKSHYEAALLVFGFLFGENNGRPI